MALQFIDACKKQGIDVLITSTYRDAQSQDALYAQGRTKAGSKVTNARGGWSFHNYAIAFDFVPIVAGKAQWNDLKTFERCGVIAESIGLEWAGRWKSFKELAHCQFTDGLTIKDLQSGKQIRRQ
jgi:peptidoglycan L-alanyl-D-glutamate endopeptidase CwlK